MTERNWLKLEEYRMNWRRLLRMLVVLALFFIPVNADTVQADVVAATQAYSKLSKDQKVQLTINLIATGDYNGLYSESYSARLNSAVEAFQSREGIPPTGILSKEDNDLLQSRADAFLMPLGMKEYKLQSTGSTLLVPRALFDSEAQTAWGYSFLKAVNGGDKLCQEAA